MSSKLDFFLQQMKDNAKALEVVSKQMTNTNDFLEEAVNNLEGEDRKGAIDLRDGIQQIFEKAKSGDMSFGNDLEQLKQKLSKYTENGRNSNG